jgi:hypothetical protein
VPNGKITVLTIEEEYLGALLRSNAGVYPDGERMRAYLKGRFFMFSVKTSILVPLHLLSPPHRLGFASRRCNWI